MARALSDTVQHRDGHQYLPLPDGIGRVRFVNDLYQAELDAALAVLRGSADGSPLPAGDGAG